MDPNYNNNHNYKNNYSRSCNYNYIVISTEEQSYRPISGGIGRYRTLSNYNYNHKNKYNYSYSRSCNYKHNYNYIDNYCSGSDDSKKVWLQVRADGIRPYEIARGLE